MGYILGVDTGGTYTDGVLIDANTKKVYAKAKALTTKGNLVVGINNCIEALAIDDVEAIDMVCISTTLATNAVVENKGCKVGLIVLGKKIKEALPTDMCSFAEGLFTIQGKLERDLDCEGVEKAFSEMENKVHAIAISGYASTRNSEHELKAKEIIAGKTDMPVVCAHEITTKLGYYERTVTAILNARLLPIIKTLINDTKTVLKKRGISSPLMIVKGDGTFMTSNSAEEKPIETILSGPAASVIGTLHLANLKNGTIVDIGGTTSDIAMVNNGFVKIRPDGAVVGDWRTHVMAADIYTSGVGGDSKMRISQSGNVTFGPDKTTPISLWLNEEKNDEQMIKIIEEILSASNQEEVGFTPTDLAHIIGLHDEWNEKAAKIAFNAIKHRITGNGKECIEKIRSSFFERIKKALDDSGKTEVGLPIAFTGAPAKAWVPEMAKQYGIEYIVPENAEVANAIGAAVGRIEEKVEIIIREDKAIGKYVGFLNAKRIEFFTLDEAKNVCANEGKNIVESRMKKANCVEYEILEDSEDLHCDSYDGKESIYLETKISIIATGNPDCIKAIEQ